MFSNDLEDGAIMAGYRAIKTVFGAIKVTSRAINRYVGAIIQQARAIDGSITKIVIITVH